MDTWWWEGNPKRPSLAAVAALGTTAVATSPPLPLPPTPNDGSKKTFSLIVLEQVAAWITLVPVALEDEDDTPSPNPTPDATTDPTVACDAVAAVVVVVVACDWIISRSAIALSLRMVAAVSTAAAT